MSYGRTPFYVYECACDGHSDEYHGPTHGRHVVFLCRAIEWDELAQFVAALQVRGELIETVERGKLLLAGKVQPERVR